MIFILKVRPVTEKDLSSSNPFLPEADDYNTYMGALRDDIARLDGIIEATQNFSSLCIETNQAFSEDELKKRIRPIFTEDIMKYLRFVSLVKS